MNFVFMNTVFMHAHLLYDGSTVTHSHPYLPAASHQHTADAFNVIAQFNLSASSMEETVSVIVDLMPEAWYKVESECRCEVAEAFVCGTCLRGPPAIG